MLSLFWSEVQGSANYFFFVRDNGDWDKCLSSWTVHLQKRYLFLCSELQVSFGEHSAYKLSSSSVLRAMPWACVLQSPVFCKIIGIKDWERAQECLALRRDQIHLDHQQMSVCLRGLSNLREQIPQYSYSCSCVSLCGKSEKKSSCPIKWIPSHHSPSVEQNMQNNWSLPFSLKTFLY